jgi:hypothetical protein
MMGLAGGNTLQLLPRTTKVGQEAAAAKLRTTVARPQPDPAA